jgi:hypothetical protein
MKADVVVTIETVVDGWEVTWWEWDGTSRDATRMVHVCKFHTIPEAMEKHARIVSKFESAR